MMFHSVPCESFVKQPSVDPAPGDSFGLPVNISGDWSIFVAVDDNRSAPTIRTLNQQSADGSEPEPKRVSLAAILVRGLGRLHEFGQIVLPHRGDRMGSMAARGVRNGQ